MTTRQKLLIFTSVVLVGNIFIGFMVYQSNQKVRASQRGAKHSKQLILQLNYIESLSKDIRIASLEYIRFSLWKSLAPCRGN
jgi:CHASE3 domain sensor protein